MGTSATNGQKFLIYLHEIVDLGLLPGVAFPRSVSYLPPHPHTTPVTSLTFDTWKTSCCSIFLDPSFIEGEALHRRSKVFQLLTGSEYQMFLFVRFSCRIGVGIRPDCQSSLCADPSPISPLRISSLGCLLTMMNDPRISVTPWSEGINTSYTLISQ